MKKRPAYPHPFVRFYLKAKYTFLGKFAPELPSRGRGKGFVLIQIDGLPHSVIQKSIKNGYMPTIKKLVYERGYALHSYFCPMPSNTPYVQTGMMYGNNKGVLGFRWVEKETGKRITFKDASSAAIVEDRAAEKGRGILAGGSSYLNLFTGDAERSVFTLSTFAAGNFHKKKVSQLDIFFLFFLYVTNILRTAVYIVIDSFLEFYEWFMLLIFRNKRRSEGIFPLIRLINNVIFREIETSGAMTDIIRGVPSVHVTFNGYDELSHHRGPEFPGVFRVLRGIDRKVKKIVNAAESCKERAYDVYIFSDHGQTPSTPFLHDYGETLARLIQKAAPGKFEITEFNSPQEVVLYEGWKYMQELAFLTISLPRVFYNGFETLRARLVRGRPQLIPFVWKEEKEQVFVNDSGPLSHIYFNFDKGKIPTREIEKKYPGLIEELINHPGIGVVTGRDKDGKGVILKGDEALKNGGEKSFLSLSEEKYAGDIIVQGAFDGREIINFEEQLSGHGGIGGGQNRPFFLVPPGSGLDVSRVKDPRDFYGFFYDNYTKKLVTARSQQPT